MNIQHTADLHQAVMQFVAEKGISAFSLEAVSRHSGIDINSVYKYHTTEGNLLYTCYDEINRQIARLFGGITTPQCKSSQDFYDFVHHRWLKYFDFLVSGDESTIFYFEYRNSKYMPVAYAGLNFSGAVYFKQLTDISLVMLQKLQPDKKVDLHSLSTYIVDTSGTYAQQIIHGVLQDNDTVRENAWRIIRRKIKSVLD